ncbi:MAG TPA: response regulator [Chthonomonadaceae bacterium]|nr:response regulator [Chthonomonadaceae bacterium]
MTVQMPPKRVLLCEDEGIILLQLRKTLLRAGYEVVGEATRGQEAIELARERTPDLILMDIDLAGPLSGIEATRQILEHYPVPILILSAYSDLMHVENALNAGACGYVVKPIISEQLLPVIEAAVARFQRLGAAVTLDNARPPTHS